ncbi:MAG: hypothetical protein P4L71_09665 [Acetobacteraceae bacterium]|nr:hypothetical protein [Acetobacteraceae bacterium]
MTAFGAVNSKGLSSTRRAHIRVALVHPAFREALAAFAKAMHLI